MTVPPRPIRSGAKYPNPSRTNGIVVAIILSVIVGEFVSCAYLQSGMQTHPAKDDRPSSRATDTKSPANANPSAGASKAGRGGDAGGGAQPVPATTQVQQHPADDPCLSQDANVWLR